jgi:hypothetical protein
MRRACVCALILVGALLPQAALAQSRSPLSIVGGPEYAHITEDEGFLGAGFGGVFGLQFHLNRQTAVEIEVTRDHHVRDLDFFAVAHDPQGRPVPLPYTERWKGNATFVLGLISHRFGTSRAPLVVWGGGGIMTHSGTTRGPLTLPDVPPNYTIVSADLQTRQGRRVNAMTGDGGAGVDVRLGERLTLRPFAGVRLTMAGGAGPKYIMRGGARLAFRL